MPTTPFATHSRSALGPLTRVRAVTPTDAASLPFITRAILVGQGGDLAVRTVDGDSLTLPALRAGVLYPLALDRIEATGTTAQSVVALS